MIPVFFLLSVLSIETIESGIARKAILSLYVLGLIGGSVHFLQKPYASSAQKMDFPIGSSGGMRSVVRENGIDRLLVQSDYFPVFNYYFQDLEKSEFRIDGNRIENDRIGTFLGQGHAGKTGIIVSDRNRPVVEAELAAGNRRFAVKPLDRVFCIVVEGDAPATRLADRDALSSP
jgi:hypothetical protein